MQVFKYVILGIKNLAKNTQQTQKTRILEKPQQSPKTRILPVSGHKKFLHRKMFTEKLNKNYGRTIYNIYRHKYNRIIKELKTWCMLKHRLTSSPILEDQLTLIKLIMIFKNTNFKSFMHVCIVHVMICIMLIIMIVKIISKRI